MKIDSFKGATIFEHGLQKQKTVFSTLCRAQQTYRLQAAISNTSCTTQHNRFRKNSHLGRLYGLMPHVTHSGVNVAFKTKFSLGDKVPISQHHDPNLRPH